MTANVITYRGRSAAREVGKVLGFEEETVTRLSSLVSRWEWNGDNDTLAALVGVMVRADLVVLLTDIEGQLGSLLISLRQEQPCIDVGAPDRLIGATAQAGRALAALEDLRCLW